MRQDISRLRKNRVIKIQLGIILGLSMSIYAFNYTIKEEFRYSTWCVDSEYIIEIVPPSLCGERPPKPAKPIIPFEVVKNSAKKDTVVLFIDTLHRDNIYEIIIPSYKKEEEFEDLSNTDSTFNLDISLSLIAKSDSIDNARKQMFLFAECEIESLSEAEKEKCMERTMMRYIFSNFKTRLFFPHTPK